MQEMLGTWCGNMPSTAEIMVTTQIYPGLLGEIRPFNLLGKGESTQLCRSQWEVHPLRCEGPGGIFLKSLTPASDLKLSKPQEHDEQREECSRKTEQHVQGPWVGRGHSIFWENGSEWLARKCQSKHLVWAVSTLLYLGIQYFCQLVQTLLCASECSQLQVTDSDSHRFTD